MDTKKCSKCGESKELDSFYRSKSGTYGRQAYCKPCASTESKNRHPDYYAKNRDRFIERAAKWAKDNPGGRRAAYMKWISSPENREKRRAAARVQNKTPNGRDRAKRYRRKPEVRRRHSEYISRKNKDESIRLSDGYVLSVMCARSQLTRAEIPDSLIEAKRVQLQIHRLLKEIKK